MKSCGIIGRYIRELEVVDPAPTDNNRTTGPERGSGLVNGRTRLSYFTPLRFSLNSQVTSLPASRSSSSTVISTSFIFSRADAALRALPSLVPSVVGAGWSSVSRADFQMSTNRLLIFCIYLTNNARAWLTGRFNSSCECASYMPKNSSIQHTPRLVQWSPSAHSAATFFPWVMGHAR